MEKKNSIFSTFKVKLIISVLVVVAVFVMITINLNGQNIEVVGGKYTVIELSTTGCHECEHAHADIDELREKYKGQININFYNAKQTFKGASLAKEYNVTIMPTIIFLDDKGKEVYRLEDHYHNEQIEEIFTKLKWIVVE